VKISHQSGSATAAPVKADPTERARQQQATAARVAASLKKIAAKKWTIDCTEPVNDGIFDLPSFEKFLHDRIKVSGKTGVLGELITVTRDSSTVSVTTQIAMSKRYLKYLTKKFLKANKLRDYIRVTARAKNNYYLRYFNFANQSADE